MPATTPTDLTKLLLVACDQSYFVYGTIKPGDALAYLDDKEPNAPSLYANPNIYKTRPDYVVPKRRMALKGPGFPIQGDVMNATWKDRMPLAVVARRGSRSRRPARSISSSSPRSGARADARAGSATFTSAPATPPPVIS